MRNRGIAAILGLAVIAGVAIYIGREWLKPAEERAEAKASVLSGAYEARIEFCGFLEDAELPEGVEPPAVGSDERYLSVVVLFPEVTSIEGVPKDYILDHVNGVADEELASIRATIDVEDSGVVLTMLFLTDTSYEQARLRREEEVVVEKVGHSTDS